MRRSRGTGQGIAGPGRAAGEGVARTWEASVGKAVRSRREAAGMTQVGLAALSGLTQAAISRLEHGRCAPTFPLLERIAQAFGAELFVTVAPGRGVFVAFRGTGDTAVRVGPALPTVPSRSGPQRQHPGFRPPSG
ncbi:helix-turn-helix domain-containing protein [Streptomyces sp. JHA26]|uniref:helix-turn-helix domain-containing protein n=1 Tax=Streptomyces sp. JHA26 TaxID=1917143 RepID=UPI00098A0318|nr:helix-turn-helix transcriptional regulator [Streptomyces sp. JHA26]